MYKVDLMRVPLLALGEARQVAHWALQIPTAVASRLIEVQADDSHSNFGWSALGGGALLSHGLATVDAELRVGLSFYPLELLVTRREAVVATVALEGETLSGALRLCRDRLERASGGAIAAFELRDYEMPPHPLFEGSQFASSQLRAELAQLADWFGTFHRCFARLTERLRLLERLDLEVADARIWPHHFDLGGLVTLSRGLTQGERRGERRPSQLGFGLSPGDGLIDQPYVYVNPYPGPPETEPWELPDGWHWQNDGFSGAVLLGEVAADLDELVLRRQLLAVAAGGLRLDGPEIEAAYWDESVG